MTLVLAGVGGTIIAPTLVAPGPVVGLTVAQRDAAADVSWSAPLTVANAAPITGYTITATTASGLIRVFTVAGDRFPVGITALTNGATWTVAVVANSAAGDSAASSGTVAPVATAGAPLYPVAPRAARPAAPVLTAADTASAAAMVTWLPPVDNGGAPIESYRLTAAAADGSVVQIVMPATGAASETAVLGPLVNGVPYAVTVRARNAGGESEPSNARNVTATQDAPEIGQPAEPQQPAEYVPDPEPTLAAFPASYPMAPAFFLKTADEADAILATSQDGATF